MNLLLALRQDALSELDVFTGRIPNVFGNYLALDRLDRAAARTAITGPIARYNELAEGGSVEIEDERSCPRSGRSVAFSRATTAEGRTSRQDRTRSKRISSS